MRTDEFMEIKSDLQRFGQGYFYQRRLKWITDRVMTSFKNGLISDDEFHELCDMIVKLNMEITRQNEIRGESAR